MGIGDEIMASGNAKLRYAADPTRRVMITDLNGKPRWSDMWEGLPWVAHPIRDRNAADLQHMKDGPRCRPYIDYVKGFTRTTGINFIPGWRVREHPGHIQLTGAEMRFASDMAGKLGPFVIVEPMVKTAANPNKQWGRAKWQTLADLLAREGLHPIQIGPPDTARLDGVTLAVTASFRYGAALMKFARWNFLPDGGLHHACGALGMPATVLWGGANDPETLGYADHENIFTPPMCGKWLPCPHCRRIWNDLTAEEVFKRTKENPRWK